MMKNISLRRNIKDIGGDKKVVTEYIVTGSGKVIFRWAEDKKVSVSELIWGVDEGDFYVPLSEKIEDVFRCIKRGIRNSIPYGLRDLCANSNSTDERF